MFNPKRRRVNRTNASIGTRHLSIPHDPTTLYFASTACGTTNRGDDWSPISGDLTRNEERLSLPIMGRKQSWDNAWDVGAMSNYNTITSLSESPLRAGLLYAGTDDGFIQVTANGGEQWTKIPVTRLGLPARSFVNDIKADLHDENTVYAVLDNHKEGDFNPYLYKSTDRGQTWTSLSKNLPKRTLLWRIVQDHVNKNLFFLATEFGVYTSLDGGVNWQKLPGTPNMGFRDLVIQKRENDLVAASFGRGFYVLDDYSALREMTPARLKEEGTLFTPRTNGIFQEVILEIQARISTSQKTLNLGRYSPITSPRNSVPKSKTAKKRKRKPIKKESTFLSLAMLP